MMNKKSIIIDTDFGGDPDDILAVWYAIQSNRYLPLVYLTSDEYETSFRSNVLASFLHINGINSPVFYGKDLGNRNLFLLNTFVNTDERFPIKSVSKRHGEIKLLLQELVQKKGIYISIGPLTNLAFLYDTYPDLLSQCEIIAMGGAINYRKPGTAEHNIRMDIEAAKKIFNADLNIRWILSDVTFTPRLRISKDHAVYKHIQRLSSKPTAMIKENLDRFYEDKYPDSYLHDPLTVMSTTEEKLVQFSIKTITMRENGEFILSPDGKKTKVSTKVDYGLFFKHFEEILQADR